MLYSTIAVKGGVHCLVTGFNTGQHNTCNKLQYLHYEGSTSLSGHWSDKEGSFCKLFSGEFKLSKILNCSLLKKYLEKGYFRW
jgi:hypothetical protein